jgi:glutamine synthetase
VFSAAELRSRYEILLQNYVNVIHIEAETMMDMVSRNILPAVSAFSAKLCDNAKIKAEVAGVACGYEKARCREISRHTDTIYAIYSTLGEAMHHADAAEDTLERAMRYKDDVVGAMNALREACDACEAMIPTDQWPYPSYTDILFSVK